MTADEVAALKEGDTVSYTTTKDGHVLTYRAQCDIAVSGSRFIRVQWLNGSKCYDVVDRASPVWRNMVKRS
jgi:hypothetical protein